MPTIFVVAMLAIVAGLAFVPIAKARDRRARESGRFAKGFLYVEDDGSVRELTAQERQHLTREFDPADGMPYIKASYRSLDLAGSMRGFIRRRHVPRNMRPRA